MERFKGACTDWTSYVEINRPNCLILGRFAEKQGANRFGRLILTTRELKTSAHAKPCYRQLSKEATERMISDVMLPLRAAQWGISRRRYRHSPCSFADTFQ